MTVKIKICGITNANDAWAAARAGADMLGFILYEKSPRYVTPDQAREIILRLRTTAAPWEWPDRDVSIQPPTSQDPPPRRPWAPEMVGVFVNASVDAVRDVARYCEFDIVQLHGDEPPEAAQALRESGLKVFKAFAIADAQSVARFDAYEADGYLCDTPSPDMWGGTGQTFDHTLLSAAADGRSLILAGGLNPDNVPRAIQMINPWAVDVSSGVEAAPGVKDHERIAQFVNAVALADA